MSADEIKLLGPEELAVIAREWHAYVRDTSRWTEQAWEAAHTRGLAVQRAGSKNPHLDWTLTDAGLDLYLEGCS